MDFHEESDEPSSGAIDEWNGQGPKRESSELDMKQTKPLEP